MMLLSVLKEMLQTMMPPPSPRFVTHNLMMLFFDFDAWALAQQVTRMGSER